MVTKKGWAACATPTWAMVAASAVARMSTPLPASQMSTAARQKTSQSVAKPSWMAHRSDRGTRGIATPMAMAMRVSRAARVAVCERFIRLGAYPQPASPTGFPAGVLSGRPTPSACRPTGGCRRPAAGRRR